MSFRCHFVVLLYQSVSSNHIDSLKALGQGLLPFVSCLFSNATLTYFFKNGVRGLCVKKNICMCSSLFAQLKIGL